MEYVDHVIEYVKETTHEMMDIRDGGHLVAEIEDLRARPRSGRAGEGEDERVNKRTN